MAVMLTACGSDDHHDGNSSSSSNGGGTAGSSSSSSSSGGSPVAARLITLDETLLAKNKQRLQSSSFADPQLKPAWDALIAAADKALTATPETVMNKTVAPPSGDKHDYISMGPYWWPNPATSNGLPYIRKDGVTNPDSKDPLKTDANRQGTMIAAAQNLSLAYYFTGDQKYAKQAAEVLRTWYLKPDTRMNPNLRYGQAVLGVVDGRGTGLIDTSNLWKVIDAIALIAPSQELTQSEVDGLKKWFSDYAAWMVNSKTGHEEYVWHNNHGTYYDAQLAAYYLFTDQTAKARQVIYDAQTKRLALQVAASGKQFMELERTRPFNYSANNLFGLELIARYGEQVNTASMPTPATDDSCAAFPQIRCAINVWSFEVDGRKLKSGIDYMTDVTIANQPDKWAYKGSAEATYPRESMVPVLLLAERAYKTGAYATALKSYVDNDANSKKSVDRLLWSAD